MQISTSPAMPGSTRRIRLEGPANFRDLGGYLGAGGRPVAWGRVYRSDGLDTATVEDREILVRRVGLSSVVDLRTHEEVARSQPAALIAAGVAHHHIPILDQTRRLWEDAGDTFSLVTLYDQMLDGAADRLLGALRLIASADGPLVFHCAAGKDRTGILAALLLGLLGVSDEEVVDDYALTAEITPVLAARFRERLAADPESADRMRAIGNFEAVAEEMLSARRETMVGWLAGLRSRFGGAAGWAAAHGFDAFEAAGLQAKLLNGH